MSRLQWFNASVTPCKKRWKVVRAHRWLTLVGDVNCSNLFGLITAASVIVCVLKMDHHCPWVANCVGEGNYKFFFHFVVYAFLALSMCVRALSGPFQAALFSEDAPRGAANFSAMAVVGFVLGGALAISLLGFIAVHSYLLVHGATTIECHQYGRAFPFNQGWRKNFNDVFGDTTKDWLLPTTPARKQRYVLHPAELEHLTADSCFGDSSDQEDDSLL
ncbi:hypothetical protein, variant 4 [Phytophthora nicotianae]|uniref:Palmitoyltransferase n=1 Tax=Phytophthora nicotianae TaxID=4792 RepID=W2L537_PHYNI|nr:hypothetical protein, variant 2 [Phytophthora nicotianae]ETL91939.1 hypothetical protein, variant 3 [Phytophthora nicotianae]ETL91940.1 hypothetical protein, variant 4 [Phytophthora nicotianae]